MANTHELATTDYMNAQRVVQNCVLKNQSTVIEEMIRANLISEEYLYPFVDDVMEWWLIDSWLAERLKEQGEVIIEEYGCFWWGRQSSGQAIYMDGVIQEICGNDSQLTTNKVSIPYSRLLDRNFVFKNFAQLNTATAPERARCFAISAEYATFAVTY